MSSASQLCSALLLLCLFGALPSCQVAVPDPPKIAAQPDDLLYRAREWRQEVGMVGAREKVADELAKMEDSKGELETRVKRTNADRRFTYSDSMAALPRSVKRRTGIYMVLGFRQNTGPAAETLRHLARMLREDGGDAHVVPLNEWGSPRDHAKAIEEFLRGNLHKVDRAVMVGFSMGANSWVRWMTDHSRKWPVSQRRKFQLGVFFAASYRGAAAARWGVEGKGLFPAIFRSKLKKLDGGKGEALAAVGHAAKDPWADEQIPPLEDMFPGFQVVEYVALPDGENGLPARQAMIRRMAGPISRAMPWVGPFDGMVESASQVLPPTDSTPQWIVRVYSSHGITEGTYHTGGEVSAEHGQVEGARPLAGEDMVRDLLRAMPSRVMR
jgi:hypothetical protein